MRLYGRMCGLSQLYTSQFLPSHFTASQKLNKSEIRIYVAVRNILETKKKMSISDWRKLSKVCSDRGFAYQAYSALLSKNPGLPEIRNLFSAFEEENIFTLIMKAQATQVFKIYESECTEEDHKFILDTVSEIMNKFQVLTPQIVRPLLYGVGITSMWKEKCEELGSKLTKMDPCVYELSAIAAFKHNDFNYAWDQFRKAATTKYGDNISPELFQEIVECHKLNPNEGILSKLFNIIEEFSLMLPISAAEEIAKTLNEDISWVSRFSSIDLDGVCGCCKRKLRKIPLTSEESESLLESVEKRFEVDCKFSTYEGKELRHFKMFLKISPPYTAVIDGANLFYRRKVDSHDFTTAKKTVEELERHGHKILLLGRNHLKVSKEFISMFKNHLTYFVKDRSVDDAYIIYAAISSGPNTIVISNDFFGTYYAEMPQESRLVFKKWQLSHQVVCTGYLGSNLVMPEISPICQTSEDDSSIHIPIVPDNARHSFSPSGWLCIQNVTEQQKKQADTLWPVRKFEAEDLSHYAFRNHVHNIRERIGSQQKKKDPNIRKEKVRQYQKQKSW